MVWGNFFGNISFILGGLDPCPDGLGHFFRDEVPQSARLSAGGCKSYKGNARMPFTLFWVVLPLLLLGRTIEARRGVELHMNDGKDDNSDLVHQGQFETFPKIHPFWSKIWRVRASLATLFILSLQEYRGQV